jgi:hypothetical protein
MLRFGGLFPIKKYAWAFKKVAQMVPNGPNCPKWLEMPQKAQKVPKWPKMTQNGPKWPKLAQNGPKWCKLPQICHSGCKPKMFYGANFCRLLN